MRLTDALTPLALDPTTSGSTSSAPALRPAAERTPTPRPALARDEAPRTAGPRPDAATARTARARAALDPAAAQRRLQAQQALQYEDLGKNSPGAFSARVARTLTKAGYPLSERAVRGLARDVDGDGRWGVDALELSKLTGASQSELLRVLVEDGGPGVRAPAALGTRGGSEIAELQQRLAAKNQLFLDTDGNGKIDPTDEVYSLDAAGNRVRARYGDLDPELRESARETQARVDVLRDYDALPSERKIAFALHGQARVNEDLWTTDGDDWALKPGVRPSEAVADLTLHGERYGTECAGARTALLLRGRLEHLRRELGPEEGDRRFDAWLANEDGTHTLAIHGHQVETPAGRLQFSNDSAERGPGRSGYFHNIAASVDGVNVGYVGENVVDLGMKDGERVFWGHPGGIKTASAWREELDRLAVPKTSADIAQAFAPGPTRDALETGFLSSRAQFERHLGSSDFRALYRARTGTAYRGPTDLARIPAAELRALVELAAPETKAASPYARVYADVADHPTVKPYIRSTSWQIAELLKNGRLPAAPYAPDRPLELGSK